MATDQYAVLGKAPGPEELKKTLSKQCAFNDKETECGIRKDGNLT